MKPSYFVKDIIINQGRSSISSEYGAMPMVFNHDFVQIISEPNIGSLFDRTKIIISKIEYWLTVGRNTLNLRTSQHYHDFSDYPLVDFDDEDRSFFIYTDCIKVSSNIIDFDYGLTRPIKVWQFDD